MRRIIPWSIAVWCLLLRGVLAASSVSTTDGLALRFGAGGALEALVVDGQPLPAAGLAGGFCVSEVSGEGAELIANGSLEEDRAGKGAPDGTTKDGVWQRDHTVARTGKWSMKAVVPGPADGMSGSFGVIVPVEGGATYVASFWLKCEGRSSASIGYLQQRNEKGARTTEVVQRQMSGSVTGTRDWTPVRMMLTTEGDTRQLYFRTDIYHGTGTLWADDFSLKKIAPTAVPLATRAAAADGGVRLEGRDAGMHLRIDAIWKPAGGMLRLDGQVVCTDERERCVRLAYRLPLAALGGTWGADIGTAKPIAPGGIYSRTEAFRQFGPYSIYPFSAVVTTDKKAGVSLGVPMDPPRPFRLTYAANQGLAVEWDLALSALPTLFPRTADFHAVLYRHDPKWGFRSAAERYYRLFPDYFTVRVKHFGNWYYADLGKFTHPEDFGLAYNEMVTKDSVAADHKLGYLNFAYTEPWGWWGWALGLKPKADDPKPSYEQMAQVLNDRAGNAVQAAATGMNAARVAETILNSGAQNRQGRFVFGAEYVARWGGYSWALNASPYAAPEGKLSRFRATYEWEIEPKLALGADGIYLDSVSNWTHLPNYRREHLERSRHPLTFTSLDPAPAQLGVWHHYEFIEHLSNDLHRRGRLLMANIFPYDWVFFNHRLDVMGHEVWGADDLEKRRAQRTLAYHKPYTWLMQQGDAGPAADREKWMQQAMLYGIAPNVVGGAPQAARYEKWRPLYKTYMPVIMALCEAGWEPVTQAAAEPGAVLLERFGPKDGTLFLTACNPGTQALTVTITVDVAALGLASPAKAVRLPGERELAVAANRFQDTLEPGVTCAYRLGQN